MFKYTKAVLNDIVNDLRKFLMIFTIVTQVFYIGYIIYAIVTGTGNAYVNYVLLAISVIYFAIYLIAIVKKDKATKALKSVTGHVKKILKLLLKAFNLGIALYGMYYATTQINPVSIILTTFMILFWVMQALSEIIYFFAKRRIEMMIAGVQKDTEKISNVKNFFGNTIKKIKGEKIEEKKPMPTKVKNYLDRVLEEHKQQKAEKKAKKKEEKKKIKDKK